MEDTSKETTPNVSRRNWVQLASRTLAGAAASSLVSARAQAPIRYPDPRIVSVAKAGASE